VEEESRLAVLGEACLGAGDARRARALVEEALPMARQRGNVWSQMLSSLSWARVLLATAAPARQRASRRSSGAFSGWR
jgi:ATP/maltotriose-dependent transcriptional regulator MalT